MLQLFKAVGVSKRIQPILVKEFNWRLINGLNTQPTCGKFEHI